MGTFDFWIKWGEKLSQKQFANAFTALGILPSKPAHRVRLISEDQLIREGLDYNKFVKGELVHALLEELRFFRQGLVPLMNWRYPMPSQHLHTDQLCIPLATLNPLLVSEIWSEVIRNLNFQLRLRVFTYPKLELVKPWFQLLLESDSVIPYVNSAYIDYDFNKATIELKWPLRLGFLPENDLDSIIDSVINHWKEGNIVKAVKIGRENANCDILVFNGTCDQLLQVLNKLPVPMKCNLFIIKGDFSNQPEAWDKQFNPIAEKCLAGGFIFIRSDISDKNLINGLNRFIETLCDDKTIDIAASDSFKSPNNFSYSKAIIGFKYSFKSSPDFDPLIIFDKRIAGYHLQQLAIKMQKQIQLMPGATKISLPNETIRRIDKTLSRFGPPIENTKNLGVMLLGKSNFESIFSRGVLDHEYEGAKTLGEINMALDRVIVSEDVQEKSQERFIQAQTFVMRDDKYEKENRAFLLGIKSRIRIRIGAKEKEWISPSIVFPVEKLPIDVESWRLTVVLSEPNHLKKPLHGEIKLPKYGSSTECDFDFIPIANPLFDGRVTVLHRGRILQTAVLRFDVVNDLRNMPKEPQNRLITETIQVRAHIEDLEQRRQFDLAFVTNHNSDTRPRLTAVSKNHAWFTELSGCIPIATEINHILTQVAGSVNDYCGEINTKNNTEIIVKLAQCGARLRNIITEELDALDNKPHFTELQYLQIVTTQNDKVIPFEFIYDQEAPEDNAKFCSLGCKALSDIMKLGDVNKVPCFIGCNVEMKDYVCPIAFWGIQKVIERHRYVPGLGENNRSYYMQSSEVTSNRETLMLTGNILVAASKRVKSADLDSVINICTQRFGLAHKANDWKQWVEIVKREKPRILLVMPHTEGENTSATLEIGGDTKKSNLMEYGYVRPKDADYYPLVALLGCDTAGTAENFGSHVVNFRQYKAAVVIGTIASVFGEHAAIVTKRLVEGLSRGTTNSERIGEVIRSIKQQSLLEGMLMPLCVVAFGDADWKLK